jgi:enoyl-CoA hydratase/carnithine racemase
MIELDKDGGLWVVRINRPDKANSLTETMLAQLADVAEGATEVGAKALILTGTGRVFSAGADLDEARAGLATSPVWERLSAAVAAFPGLSVAALNGTLAGGAFGMVLACDIRVAVESARFFYPPVTSDARLRANMLTVAGSWSIVSQMARRLPRPVLQ